MFQHILVPLDGSSRAERALPVAARVARASGGTLTLVHVVEGFQAAVSYGAMNPVSTPDVIERSLGSAKTYLEQVRLHSDLAGIPLDTQVVLGHPALGILSLLDTQAIDLAVLSSHGSAGVRHWLLGSIAEKVVQASPVPVLLLRGDEPLCTHMRLDGTRSVRALVPLDGSTRALEAIDPVAALLVAFSSPGQGEIHLLQIVRLPEDVNEEQKKALLEDTSQYLQQQSEHVRKRLAATFGANCPPTLKWSVVPKHDIAEGIIRVAEHGEKSGEARNVTKSDLLAMTTHGGRRLQQWAMGSIAERVLHASTLPILLVRPADIVARNAGRESTRDAREISRQRQSEA